LLKAKVDVKLIAKAIHYAKIWHKTQFRESGEPYYLHPLEVANIVSDYCFDTDIIITSILHDTIEDTIATQEVIKCIFGLKIAENVSLLTRKSVNGIKISAAQIVDNLLEQRRDDLLTVKLFDRVHNIRTIGAKSLDGAKKVIQETVGVFIDLANYLRMPEVGDELLSVCEQHFIINTNTTLRSKTENPAKLANFIYLNINMEHKKWQYKTSL